MWVDAQASGSSYLYSTNKNYNGLFAKASNNVTISQ